MPYNVEILGAPLPGEKIPSVVRAIVRATGISQRTALRLAEATPCVVEGLPDARSLDVFVDTVERLGLDIRIGSVGSGDGAAGEPPFESATNDSYDDAEEAARLKDYYRLLGIPPSASPEAIKRAFRDRSKQFHPDRYRDSPRLAFYVEMQKAINEAYSVLSDPDLRREYDAKRQDRTEADPVEARRWERAEEDFIIAITLLDEGFLREAIVKLTEVVAMAPSHAEALSLLATIYLEVEEFERARAYAKRLAGVKGGGYEALVMLATCAIYNPHDGRIDEAIRLCDRAIKLAPNEPLAHVMKARAFRQMERPKDAAAYLAERIERIGRHPLLLFWLGIVLTDLHDYAPASALIAESARLWGEAVDPELEAELLEVAQTRFEQVQSVDASAISEKDGKSEGGSFWFWVGIVVFTVTPPHFIGVLLLIGYLLMRGSEKKTEARTQQYRDLKGYVAPDVLEQSNAELVDCRRCAFMERKGGSARCQLTRDWLRGQGLDSLNPCRGQLFVNLHDTSVPLYARGASDREAWEAEQDAARERRAREATERRKRAEAEVEAARRRRREQTEQAVEFAKTTAASASKRAREWWGMVVEEDWTGRHRLQAAALVGLVVIAFLWVLWPDSPTDPWLGDTDGNDLYVEPDD